MKSTPGVLLLPKINDCSGSRSIKRHERICQNTKQFQKFKFAFLVRAKKVSEMLIQSVSRLPEWN